MAGAERPAHRKLPYAKLEPDQRLGGWCGWCGLPSDGPRMAFHPACTREHRLMSEQAELIAAVVARDGCVCAMCGKDGWIGDRPAGAYMSRRLELDHRVPLWAVAHLDRAARRAFFTPANMQLLCSQHHKAKTSGEAAARAELARRLALPEPLAPFTPPTTYAEIVQRALPQAAKIKQASTPALGVRKPLTDKSRAALARAFAAQPDGMPGYEYDGPENYLRRVGLLVRLDHPTRRGHALWMITDAGVAWHQANALVDA